MPLEGKWYNELGSEMDLKAEGKRLTGTYRTAVAEGPLPPPTPLVGVLDGDSQPGKPQSLAFAVAWPHPQNELGSSTAWSGALRQLKDDSGKVVEEVIVTRWLLTTETAEDWTSTTIGEDVFQRNAPSDAEVRRARAIRQLSPLPVSLGRKPSAR